MRRKNRLALVIPARNEQKLLPRVLDEIPDRAWRVILVDDGSRDRTWERMISWEDSRAVRVRLVNSLGVGGAIVTGYQTALRLGADAAVVVAADAQMDLGEIDDVLHPIERGSADYVQGNRFSGNSAAHAMPLLRRMGNRLLSRVTSWASGQPVGDSQCGFTAASAEFLHNARLDELPRGYGFPAYLRLQAHRMGARVEEVPVSALYGEETSGIHPLIDPVRICFRLVRHGIFRRASGSIGTPGTVLAEINEARLRSVR